MNESFISQVEYSIDYDSVKIEGYDYESRYGKVDVKYNVEIELRDWGVKSIMLSAPSQILNLELELQSLSDDEDIVYKSFKINLTDIKIENPEIFGQINPQEINLTLKNLRKINEEHFEVDASAVLVF